MAEKKNGRGWHGDPAGHAKAGKKGGETTSQRFGREFYEKIGEKGGEASGGKFEKGSERAKQAGKKGGESRAKNQ
ncbi:MAG TPA: stress-induced protein [Patescibacteria group bacterium]